MSIVDIKVDRRIYDISTPNSDKKIDISVQDQHGAKLFFKMNMDSYMFQLMYEVLYRFIKHNVSRQKCLNLFAGIK